MSNEEKSGLKHWVPAFVLMVCVVLLCTRQISQNPYPIRVLPS